MPELEQNLNNLRLDHLKHILEQLQQKEKDNSTVIMLSYIPNMKAMLVVRDLGLSVIQH